MRLALVVPAGLLLAGALVVSGCGGSDHNQSSVPSTNDSFVTDVRQQTDTPAAMSETSAPVEVAAIVETSPENTEPQAVKF